MEYKDFSNKKLSPEELREILKVAVVPKEHILKDLVLLEKNANIMTKAKLERLAENMKHDGRLTQWPFVMKLPDGRYGVPSGNHRVKAGILAGIEKEWCITCEVTLPADEATRIQISHNAIHGDQQNIVLLEIANSMKSVELLRLSGADFDLAKINQDKLEFQAIDSGSLEFVEVLLYFSGYEVKKLNKLLKDLDSRLDNPKNPVYIADKAKYTAFIDAITKVKRDANIKSTATALNAMIDYCAKNIDNLVEELIPKKETKK